MRRGNGSMSKSELAIFSEITILKRIEILLKGGGWVGGLVKDEDIIRQGNHSVDSLHLSPCYCANPGNLKKSDF